MVRYIKQPLPVSPSRIALAGLLVCVLDACGGARTPAGPVAPSGRAEAVAVEVLGPAAVTCGVPFEVDVVLRPGDGLELTRGYPFTVEMAPVDDPAAAATARARDAVEATAGQHRYRITLPAADAGPAEYVGVISYSVCSPRTCVPGVERFGWATTVTCDDLPQ